MVNKTLSHNKKWGFFKTSAEHGFQNGTEIYAAPLPLQLKGHFINNLIT